MCVYFDVKYNISSIKNTKKKNFFLNKILYKDINFFSKVIPRYILIYSKNVLLIEKEPYSHS